MNYDELFRNGITKPYWYFPDGGNAMSDVTEEMISADHEAANEVISEVGALFLERFQDAGFLAVRHKNVDAVNAELERLRDRLRSAESKIARIHQLRAKWSTEGWVAKVEQLDQALSGDQGSDGRCQSRHPSHGRCEKYVGHRLPHSTNHDGSQLPTGYLSAQWL